MEGREVTHTEKVYCCSNYPQTESSIIAKFDLVLETLGLVTAITFISVVASLDDPAQQTHYASNVTNDPSMFFSWPRERQLIALSFSIAGRVFGIVISILLLIGVRRKNHGYLLAWFILTIIWVIISVILGVDAIIHASDRLLLIVLVIASFLYKWYCLWIVKLLMSEIRAVREGGYANPLDDGEIEANTLVPTSDSFIVDKF